jgi:hypothetical protein
MVSQHDGGRTGVPGIDTDGLARLAEHHKHTIVRDLAAEVLRLREGLRQVVEGDYPSDALNAETWAGEVLADSHAVDWNEVVADA